MSILSLVSLAISCFAAGVSCAALYHAWMRGRLPDDQAAYFSIVEEDPPVKDGIYKS